MMKRSTMMNLILWSLAVLCINGASANDDLVTKAAKYHAEQKWPEVIKTYGQLTQLQPQNELAWFRLANAHIQLKQGQAALNANAQLNAPQQIPASFIQFQKAQAFSLLGKTNDMWRSLQTAAEQGYSNLSNLRTDPVFEAHRDTQQYTLVSQAMDKNLRPCMYDDRYREFDFWLGRWDVYGDLAKTGPMAGKNSITQAEQGCLIMEDWQGAGGSTGMSMNYYDGIKQQWVQRWVSGGGTVADYAGGLIEIGGIKVMRLEGKIFYASKQQQPQVRAFRGTWTPLEDGVVQQFFEESIDGGKTWYPWFNGFYFPSNEVDKNAQ